MKRAILILLSVFVILLASCGGSITPGEYNYSAATYTIDEDSRYISIAYPVLTGTDYDDAANELLLSESLEQMENYLTYSAGANDGRFYRYTIDSVSSQCLGRSWRASSASAATRTSIPTIPKLSHIHSI